MRGKDKRTLHIGEELHRLQRHGEGFRDLFGVPGRRFTQGNQVQGVQRNGQFEHQLHRVRGDRQGAGDEENESDKGAE